MADSATVRVRRLSDNTFGNIPTGQLAKAIGSGQYAVADPPGGRPAIQDEAAIASLDEQAPKNDSLLGGIGNMLGSLAKAPFGIGAAVVTPPETTGENVAAAVGGPVGVAAKRLVLDPQVNLAKTAYKKAVNERSSVEAAGYGAAAMLPLLGPFAAHLGEEVGAGYPMTAVGEAGTAALAPKLVEGTPLFGRAYRALGRAAGFGAKTEVIEGVSIPVSPIASADEASTAYSTAGFTKKLGFGEKYWNALQKFQQHQIGEVINRIAAKEAAFPVGPADSSPSSMVAAARDTLRTKAKPMYRAIDAATQNNGIGPVMLDEIRGVMRKALTGEQASTLDTAASSKITPAHEIVENEGTEFRGERRVTDLVTNQTAVSNPLTIEGPERVIQRGEVIKEIPAETLTDIRLTSQLLDRASNLELPFQTAQEIRSAMRRLRDGAQDAGQRQRLSLAINDMSNAMERALQRGGRPDLVSSLRSADATWAKMYVMDTLATTLDKVTQGIPKQVQRGVLQNSEVRAETISTKPLQTALNELAQDGTLYRALPVDSANKLRTAVNLLTREEEVSSGRIRPSISHIFLKMFTGRTLAKMMTTPAGADSIVDLARGITTSNSPKVAMALRAMQAQAMEASRPAEPAAPSGDLMTAGSYQP